MLNSSVVVSIGVFSVFLESGIFVGPKSSLSSWSNTDGPDSVETSTLVGFSIELDCFGGDFVVGCAGFGVVGTGVVV